MAVNGKSLLNMPYEESLKLLQNTGHIVELTVSQIFAKYQQKQQLQQQQQQHMYTIHKSEANKSNSIGNSIKATNAHHYAKDENQKMMAHFAEDAYSAHRNPHNNKAMNTDELLCFVHDDYDNNNHETIAVNAYSQFDATKSFTNRGFKNNHNSADALLLNSSSRDTSDNCSMPDKVNLRLS